jgi:anti-sigma B factor antagonist
MDTRRFYLILAGSIISTAQAWAIWSALSQVSRKQGGDLKLLNLTKNVHNVMQLTRLYTVFETMDDEATAIKSFGQSAAATG